MQNGRKEPLSRRDNMRPRSPSEALEPARAPSRPKGVRPGASGARFPGFIRVISGIMTVVLIVMLSAGGLTLLRPPPLR